MINGNINDSIIKNKALILKSNFDCKTLHVAPVVKKNNYYSKNNNYIKKEVVVVPDCESDVDDFCDFIDT